MSLEENKAIVRGLTEAENERNYALFDEFLAPDFVNIVSDGTPPHGREIYKQGSESFFKAFPDFHGTIEDITAEGDKVWIRYKATGTHTGEFMGLAPTGKKVTMNAFSIYRIVDSKIVEMRSFIDTGCSYSEFFKELGGI